MSLTCKGELMFPSMYLAAPDLQGKEVTVTIESIEKKPLRLKTGGEEMKWIIRFKGAQKVMVLNKTNANAIADLHGNDADEWVGKRVSLYPSTCNAFGKISDCIRVRDKAPK